MDLQRYHTLAGTLRGSSVKQACGWGTTGPARPGRDLRGELGEGVEVRGGSCCGSLSVRSADFCSRFRGASGDDTERASAERSTEGDPAGGS
jgi:hypothetical protein